jgi:hypothetical protein
MRLGDAAVALQPGQVGPLILALVFQTLVCLLALDLVGGQFRPPLFVVGTGR